jgi:DNA-binding XRE family transcriptional regulator
MSKTTEKIKEIMEQTGFTPSLFADEVGIARASMSHILAGRNKPSLPILVKIIKRFPQFGMDWILEEEETDDSLAENDNFTKDNSQVVTNKTVVPKQATSSENFAENRMFMPVEKGKKVEKILVFYTDRTFTEYSPNP